MSTIRPVKPPLRTPSLALACTAPLFLSSCAAASTHSPFLAVGAALFAVYVLMIIYKVANLTFHSLLMFDLMPHPLLSVAVDRQGGYHIKRLNRAARRSYFVQPCADRGIPTWDSLKPEMRANVERCVQSRRQVSLDMDLDQPGDCKAIRVTVDPVVNAGRVIRAMCAGQDVTEIRETLNRHRDMQQTFNAILDASPLAMLMIDPEGNIQWWSIAAERLFGWAEAEVIGKQDPTIPPKERVNLHVQRQITSNGENVDGFETKRLKKDGTIFDARVNAAPIMDASGKVIGSVAIVTDISERKDALDALRESERRYRNLADNASDVVFRLRLWPQQEMEYISPSVEILTGYTPTELMGYSQSGWQMIFPESQTWGISDVAEADLGERSMTARVLHKNGSVIWVEAKVVPIYEAGRLLALEGIARDITDRKIIEDQLIHLSTHDELTGLYNRRFFEARLHALESAGRYPFALVSTDADGLKLINDSLGHATGDRTIQACAQVLQSAAPEGAVVARVGGDEFAVLLPETSASAAEAVIQRIEESIVLHNAENEAVPLSVSIGMAIGDGPDVTADELMGQADKNMYRDKLHRSTSAAHGIVRSLLTALAAKDHITEGHTARVALMASSLGESLHLSKKEISDIGLLAEVHDLGKVGTPDRILFKRGPLTASEQEEVKQHSLVGYRIAKATPELSHIADLILYHHERWDGSGYPRKLKGDEIPLACRILAIADAYDAMTNDRPYRNAMAADAAIQELQRCAGTQFDPALVGQFIEVVGSYYRSL